MKKTQKVDVSLPSRMVFSAMGGMGAATVCHPLDTLRVNLQVDCAGGSARQYNGMLDAATKIVHRNGFSRGLYAGLTAAYLRQWTYGSCRVGIYSFLQDKMSMNERPPLAILEKMGIGMVSGGVGSFVGTPSELALVRMTADRQQPQGTQRGYKNIFDCLGKIAREEGASALWKGATPTVLRAMLLTSTLLPSYSEAKIKLHKLSPEYFPKTGLLTMFAGTTFASAVANLIINPLDVVKSRIQHMPAYPLGGTPMYTGMVHCFARSITTEGPMVLLRGYIPAFIKLAPYTCISLVLTEKITLALTGAAAI